MIVGVKQFLALVVLTAIGSSYGVGDRGRSVKKSITVKCFGGIPSNTSTLSTELYSDKPIESLMRLKIGLTYTHLSNFCAAVPDPLSNVLVQTALVIDKTFGETLMPKVAAFYAAIDSTAPADLYGNYIWPATLYCMPIAGLSAVACGVLGEMRVAAGLSALAGISLIGVLAQAFRAPYYEAWKKNRPADARAAEAHEFGKHFLYALTALKEGRLAVTFQGDTVSVQEYDQPASS